MSKNVLITGSSNGIGAAAAIAFAKEGYNVGVTYNTNPDGAMKIAAKCESYGVQTIVLGGNVGEHEVCKKMMEDFLAKFGTIDVLINNAGGALKMPLGGFEKMPMDYWDSQINLNLNAAAYLSHYAMINMIENKIEGAIINVSSVHGTIPWVRRKTLPYAAAKAGLNMFTKNLGIEAIHYGINVNGIAPGFITTKATDRYDESDLRDGFLRKIPAGFLGNVDDITPMMLFLADKTKSRFIVGQTFIIDGGQTSDGCVDKMLDDGNPVNAYDIKPDVSKAIKPSLEELAEMTLNK